MSVTVSLSDVIEALMAQTDTSCAFVNRQTGEILTCNDEQISAAEAEADETAPQWLQPELPKIREALAGDPWLPLPTKFDIHEWDMMRQFADEQRNEKVGRVLHAAIHGAGAFRCFRETLSHLGMEEQWYRFRDRQFEGIAKDWLTENGLEFR